MIEMLRQPIVNIVSKQVIIEEMLCRPESDCCIKDYLTTKDPHLLWQREYHAILQGIERQNGKPINLNVSMMSLPYLLSNTALTWNGGIEIVEWGESNLTMQEMRRIVQQLQARGLSVWADDVTSNKLNFWIRVGVSGIKVELKELYDESFVNRLKKTKRAVIVERVENKVDERLLLKNGFHIAQGYLYGRAQ